MNRSTNTKYITALRQSKLPGGIGGVPASLPHAGIASSQLATTTEFCPPCPSDTWLGLFGSVTQFAPSTKNLYWIDVPFLTWTVAVQLPPSIVIGTPLVHPSGAK